MKVCLSWWRPGHRPGGRAQAIRGNVRGFLEAGHDVDLWFRDDLLADPDAVEANYDLLVVPYIDVAIDMEIPVHLQLGGYGNPDLDGAVIERALEAATSVSVLDPRLAFHYADRAGLDLNRARVIPNAPNVDLFEPLDAYLEGGHVLAPKVGGPYKRPEILNGIARSTPAITYRTFAGTDPPPVATNVVIRPAVPLSGMPDVYEAASVVLNPSVREGLPNVAFEAFASQRPFVSTPRGIALLQTIPEGVLDAGDFGLTAAAFTDAYRPLFYEGDHYKTAARSHLPDLVSDLMRDRRRRHELAERGRAWIDALDYSWRDKAGRIVEAAGL